MLYMENTSLADVQTDEAIENIATKLDEAEQLTEEARQLLVHCDGALKGEGVQGEALALERWLESYRRGISAAQKLTKTGPEILDDISMRLHQALEELQRYEAEGGNPATKSQQAQIEQLSHAVVAINKLKDSLKGASLTPVATKTA